MMMDVKTIAQKLTRGDAAQDVAGGAYMISAINLGDYYGEGRDVFEVVVLDGLVDVEMMRTIHASKAAQVFAEFFADYETRAALGF